MRSKDYTMLDGTCIKNVKMMRENIEIAMQNVRQLGAIPKLLPVVADHFTRAHNALLEAYAQLDEALKANR